MSDLGTVRLDGWQRWVKLQVSHSPAKNGTLIAISLGLVGLMGSLFIRRRRLWVRVVPGADGTATVQALISEVIDRRDLETLGHHDAETLAVNEIGRVRLRFAADLPLEPYAQSREGGSLVLIHPADGATLAAATVARG